MEGDGGGGKGRVTHYTSAVRRALVCGERDVILLLKKNDARRGGCFFSSRAAGLEPAGEETTDVRKKKPHSPRLPN